MSYLDDVLDEDAPRAERFAGFDQALSLLQSGTPADRLDPAGAALIADLRTSILAVEPERLDRIIHDTRTIGLLGERIRTAQSVRGLGLAALAEGRLTAGLIIVNPNNVASGDPTAFNAYLLQLGAFANAADTVLDMRDDYKEGILSIKPTRLHQLALAAMITPGTLRAVSEFGPQVRSQLLGKVTRMVMKHLK